MGFFGYPTPQKLQPTIGVSGLLVQLWRLRRCRRPVNMPKIYASSLHLTLRRKKDQRLLWLGLRVNAAKTLSVDHSHHRFLSLFDLICVDCSQIPMFSSSLVSCSMHEFSCGETNFSCGEALTRSIGQDYTRDVTADCPGTTILRTSSFPHQ